jgi:alcohol dehydrogenase
VYSAVSGPIEVRDVSDPTCPDDGVILQVQATGICRSDWHAWHGREDVALPHIGGHEYSGTIAEIGDAVTGLAVGDRVTVPFVCGCGACEYCAAGDGQVCPNQRQPGFDLPGSFAEYVAVPAAGANVVRLPDSVEPAEAAALGCRFATAFRAVVAHGRAAPGQWVAVHGCGGVGLSAVMIAVALGARVIAVDVSATALGRAAALGAEAQLDISSYPDPAAVGAAVTRVTGGAHVSIDAIGSAASAAASVTSLRRRGRHIQVGLLHGDDAHAALPLDRMIGWELELVGSHGMSARDYPAMLEMVVDGRLRPAELISRTVGLDGIGAALAAMDQPGSDGIPAAVP